MKVDKRAIEALKSWKVRRAAVRKIREAPGLRNEPEVPEVKLRVDPRDKMRLARYRDVRMAQKAASEAWLAKLRARA